MQLSCQRLVNTGLLSIVIQGSCASGPENEVINMLDGNELDRIVEKHQPDFIVPEIEAIRTETVLQFMKVMDIMWFHAKGKLYHE